MDHDLSESYQPADAASGIRRCLSRGGLGVSPGPAVCCGLEDGMAGGRLGMQDVAPSCAVGVRQPFTAQGDAKAV